MFNFHKNRICKTTYDDKQLYSLSFMLVQYFLKFAADKIEFSKFVIFREKNRDFTLTKINVQFS